MNRYDYFHEQKVLDTELDAGFDDCEAADRALAADTGLTGIATGLVVSELGPPSGLTVQLSAGTAYDKTGKRLRVASPIASISVATDYLSNPTDVTIVGQERVVSIFLEFDRTLSDPRIDGDSNPIDYRQTESYSIKVVAGTQSVAPATPPALDPANILLADVRLQFGTILITTAEIELDRVEHWTKFDGTALVYTAGTAKDAVQQLSTYIDASRTETRIVPATDAQVVIGGTGTVTYTDNNRTFSVTNGTEQIHVPLKVAVGETITSVTARWFKGDAGIASFSVNYLTSGIIEVSSASKPTAAAAGAQSATIDDTDDPVFFPQVVAAGRTYWVMMGSIFTGDKFHSVEYTVRMP